MMQITSMPLTAPVAHLLPLSAVGVACRNRCKPRRVQTLACLLQGMVPVDQPVNSGFLTQHGSGYLPQPVHLRDAGRAASMPLARDHAPPPWQPPAALDDTSRRRAKRTVRNPDSCLEQSQNFGSFALRSALAYACQTRR